MEWTMEENSSMEWNMKSKIFSMEWKWNGIKLPVWNMEKSFSISFHTMPCVWVGSLKRISSINIAGGRGDKKYFFIIIFYLK